MENLERAYEFLKKAGYYFLLTSDRGQPRGRAFSSKMIADGRLYLATGLAKRVWREVRDNARVELLAFHMKQGEYMRIDAETVMDDDPTKVKRYLEQEPQVRGDFTGDAEAQMGMFYLKDAAVEILALDGTVKETFTF